MTEDKEKVYDEEIHPLMAQIIAICKRENIPMVASFEYGPGDLCSTILAPKDACETIQKLATIVQQTIEGSRRRKTKTGTSSRRT